uniref:hypothetical protein n=1 Tax=Stenotrophomonas maltophilia TaxID=40324 RepID=UPI001A7E1A8E
MVCHPTARGLATLAANVGSTSRVSTVAVATPPRCAGSSRSRVELRMRLALSLSHGSCTPTLCTRSFALFSLTTQ